MLARSLYRSGLQRQALALTGYRSRTVGDRPGLRFPGLAEGLAKSTPALVSCLQGAKLARSNLAALHQPHKMATLGPYTQQFYYDFPLLGQNAYDQMVVVKDIDY